MGKSSHAVSPTVSDFCESIGPVYPSLVAKSSIEIPILIAGSQLIHREPQDFRAGENCSDNQCQSQRMGSSFREQIHTTVWMVKEFQHSINWLWLKLRAVKYALMTRSTELSNRDVPVMSSKTATVTYVSKRVRPRAKVCYKNPTFYVHGQKRTFHHSELST